LYICCANTDANIVSVTSMWLLGLF
jgi:hypothetical protein